MVTRPTEWLTLFCDASLDPAVGAAGWGAWAKRDAWRSGQTMGGVFKNLIYTSHEAELCAVANALSRLEADDAFVGVSTVMIQSDSVRAMQMILSRVPGSRTSDHGDSCPVRRTRAKPTALEKKAIKRILDFAVEHGVGLVVRHVKGHQKGDKRQWVNRQCDSIAKRHMREARAALAGNVPEGCAVVPEVVRS